MIEKDSPLLASLKSLQTSQQSMRPILEEMSRMLHANASWSRAEIFRAGEILQDRKDAMVIKGLWQLPPRMITATLDDAIGQGLQIIHLFSRLAGVNVQSMGLMQPPDKIIDFCRKSSPDILGMTLLQFHSEEILCDIVASLPPQTTTIVGGPIFKSFSRKELNNKDYLVLNDIHLFLEFLLDLK